MAGGSTTNYFHHADDRLWKEELPSLGFIFVCEYDNTGSLVQEWDEFQSLTRYEYDAENRLTKISRRRARRRRTRMRRAARGSARVPPRRRTTGSTSTVRADTSTPRRSTTRRGRARPATRRDPASTSPSGCSEAVRTTATSATPSAPSRGSRTRPRPSSARTGTRRWASSIASRDPGVGRPRCEDAQVREH